MSAADSLYQQVRSHLAYLRLGAAAEALPAHLDDALKANATHTEFLERLLATEVTAVEARRHAGLLASPTSPPHGASTTSTTAPNPPSTPP